MMSTIGKPRVNPLFSGIGLVVTSDHAFDQDLEVMCV